MAESITISLEKTMPLTERVSEANKRISEWMEVLEKPFDNRTDEFYLARYEQNRKEHIYHYIIVRDVKTPESKR